MDVDTGAFRALTERNTELEVQLGYMKGRYTELVIEYMALERASRAAAYGDQRAAGALTHGRRHLRAVDEGWEGCDR